MHVQYGLHGTVVSVHLLYSTVPTMLTVSASLLYCMPVRAALYGSFRSPAGCTVKFVPCWYNNSTLPSLLPSRCHNCLFCELHIHHHFLPQASFSSFLSLSASLSTPVLLPLIPGEFVHCCLVIFVDCCLVVCDFTMMNLVLAYSCCRCVTTILYARTVWATKYGSFRAPTVQYRFYHAGAYNSLALSSLHPLLCHVCFANSTFITTSFLKLPCLPSFPSQLLVYHCLAPSCSS
jgi:hypothetical protein